MSGSVISKGQNEKDIHQTGFWLKYTIFHLYLLQGLAFGFFCSVPLTYQTVPNYQILSMFDAASLPFSFKFLFAPLLQRFTFRRYGKRKTWIVITIFASAFFHCCLSFVVGIEQYQKTTAALLFFCTLATALKDVGSDALAVQQIANGSTISLASFAGEQIGRMISFPIPHIDIQKLLGIQFSRRNNDFFYFHADNSRIPIANRSSYPLPIQIIWQIVIQVDLQALCKVSYAEDKPPSFREMLQHYRYFIMPKYRLSRQIFVMLLMNHGMLQFTSTFSTELIKKGFQRQNLMFIQNICLVPNIMASLLICRYLTASKMYVCLQKLSFIQFAFVIFAYFSDFEDNRIVINIFTVISLLHINFHRQLNIERTIFRNSYYCHAEHFKFQQKLSYSKIAHSCLWLQQLHKFWLVYAGIVVLLLPWAHKWIKRGISVSELKIQ